LAKANLFPTEAARGGAQIPTGTDSILTYIYDVYS
jgi:hypothetical protein